MTSKRMKHNVVSVGWALATLIPITAYAAEKYRTPTQVFGIVQRAFDHGHGSTKLLERYQKPLMEYLKVGEQGKVDAFRKMSNQLYAKGHQSLPSMLSIVLNGAQEKAAQNLRGKINDAVAGFTPSQVEIPIAQKATVQQLAESVDEHVPASAGNGMGSAGDRGYGSDIVATEPPPRAPRALVGIGITPVNVPQEESQMWVFSRRGAVVRGIYPSVHQRGYTEQQALDWYKTASKYKDFDEDLRVNIGHHTDWNQYFLFRTIHLNLKK